MPPDFANALQEADSAEPLPPGGNEKSPLSGAFSDGRTWD